MLGLTGVVGVGEDSRLRLPGAVAEVGIQAPGEHNGRQRHEDRAGNAFLRSAGQAAPHGSGD